MSLLSNLRSEAVDAPASGIVEVSSYGRARQGVIAMWVGEGDTPTPPFIMDAATRSLAAGETFYTWQRGIPELRDAIARYMARTYAKPFQREQFYVTGGGMQAVQIAIRMVAGVGDEVIIPTPAWPNFAAAIGISGATTVPVRQSFGETGWTLDIADLAAAITPQCVREKEDTRRRHPLIHHRRGARQTPGRMEESGMKHRSAHSAQQPRVCHVKNLQDHFSPKNKVAHGEKKQTVPGKHAKTIAFHHAEG